MAKTREAERTGYVFMLLYAFMLNSFSKAQIRILHIEIPFCTDFTKLIFFSELLKVKLMRLYIGSVYD